MIVYKFIYMSTQIYLGIHQKHSLNLFTHIHLVTSYGGIELGNYGSVNNALVADGNKPLPESIVTSRGFQTKTVA